jgi:malate dehydrogenase (oxaloacetate-decarboxylating)
MSEFDQNALDLHAHSRGKIELHGKVKVRNREELSAAYTPGVAAVCRAIADEPERMYELTPKGNSVLVVTDGSAVLGLGNIGPEAAYPVMEGKCLLMKEFAGLDAYPLVLDTQDAGEIVEIVSKICGGFGGVNLEDIAAPRCFEVEAALRERLAIPVFHDDQHGTAIVVLAGLINALKVRAEDANDLRIVVNGAGAAGVAITELLLEYGFENIVVVDSRGAIYDGREGMNETKFRVAKRTNLEKQIGGLAEMMEGADIFIGVSKAGLVNGEMVTKMADDPIIFALANPDPEIPEVDAKAAGALVVATGRSDSVNQLNNALVFPGIFRGALDGRIKQFDKAMFIAAAEALAGVVQDVSTEKIIPSPFDAEVTKAVAGAIAAFGK